MMGLPDCNEVARHLSLECDRHDDGLRRPMGIRLHLLICGACRHYQRYLAWLQANLPRALDSASDAGLSPAQRASIRQTMRRASVR